MGLVTLIFDLLTLKLVCEWHQRWGHLPSKLRHARPLGSQIFAMYATDGHTDGRKATLIAPSYGRGHNAGFALSLGVCFVLSSVQLIR